jgi:hypothetical protein
VQQHGEATRAKQHGKRLLHPAGVSLSQPPLSLPLSLSSHLSLIPPLSLNHLSLSLSHPISLSQSDGGRAGGLQRWSRCARSWLMSRRS